MYNSPVFTTWGNLIVKSANVIFLLPIILAKFSSVDIKLWLLFQLLFSLKDIMDFGLVGNFSRSYAYAYANTRSLSDRTKNNNEQGINKQLLNSINSVSKRAYLIIAIITFIVFATLGTLSVYKTIFLTKSIYENYISWAVIVFITPITLYGNTYISFLNGINKVALVKRWDTLFSLLQVISVLVVLIYIPNILALVCATFIWYLVVMIRNYFLFTSQVRKLNLSVERQRVDKKVWLEIFPLALKDFFGGLSGFGLQKVMEIIFANIVKSDIAVSYLFASRLIEQVKMMSGVPFFSKIPYYASDFINKSLSQYKKAITQGMRLSYITMIIAILVIGIFSKEILLLIRSNISFVPTYLWALMGGYMLLERYTHMHAQQYTISENKIISHIGLPITGVLTIISVMLSYRFFELSSIPIGGFIALLLFYTWYAPKNSYQSMKTSFLKFERKLFLPVILILIPTFIFACYIAFLKTSNY